MTREIKFRAWDTPFNKMIYDNSLITINLDGTVNYGNAELTSRDTYLQYPIVLMQFTGLKDKNGKEIYEGDIVNDCKVVTFGHYDVGEYEDNESGIGWHITYQGKPLSGIYLGKNLEVLGNIYENPELLK